MQVGDEQGMLCRPIQCGIACNLENLACKIKTACHGRAYDRATHRLQGTSLIRQREPVGRLALDPARQVETDAPVAEIDHHAVEQLQCIHAEQYRGLVL